MKVLICIPCLLTGGTEIQTLNLVQALIDGGHRVTTVCYFEHNSSMVENYRRAGSEVVLLRPDGKRIQGWKVIPFLWKGLKNTLRHVHPDVVHVQYMAPGAIPILLLKLIGAKTVIATAHTPADIYPSLRIVHFIQKHCVRAFTCITERAERSFFGSSSLYNEEYVLKNRNHFTIYNALPSYIQIRSDKKQFKFPLVIGVVSRLEPIKGMDLIVPAFAKLKKEFSELKLLVVGDGSQKKLMIQQANEYEIMDSIEWAGRQGQSTIQSFYDRIDILCMPSRSEGFGLTAIEGMSRGCVVVASNTGGLPEVVKDGEIGLLHETEDVDSIVISISKLINNLELLENMSIKSIKYSHNFTFDIYSNLFNNLYSKLNQKCGVL